MTLSARKGKIAMLGELANCFSIKRGVKQGDALSTILFNVVLERAIRGMEINPGGTIYNRTSQILAYADDVVIISRSGQELRHMFMQLESESKKVGLKINESKTKYMITSRSTNKWSHLNELRIENFGFERVNRFKYLGSLITENNVITEEIKERLKDGNKCYGALLPLMKSKDLSRNAKKKIY